MTIGVLDGNLVPRRAGVVATAELDGEAVLYNEADGTVHLLNESATMVWVCCDGQATIAAIAADLSSAFGVDERQMTAQVLDLVNSLHQRDLVDL